MKRFCSVVTNEVTGDYRIQKECRALPEEYQITLLGFRRPGNSEEEVNGRMRIIRTGEPILRRIALLFPKARETLTLEHAGREGKGKIILNDLSLFLLFVNKNLSILKRLLFIKADIYQANDLDTLLPVVIVGKLRKARIIYDSHEMCVEEGFIRTRFFKGLLRLVERIGIRSCDKVLTVSDSIADALQQMHNLRNRPILVRNTPELTRIRFSRHKGTKKIIFIGVLAPMRGLRQTILAMRQVSGAILHIRGYGPSEKAFRELVRKEGLSGKVKFVPRQAPEKLVRSCSAYDIGILPYRNTCLNYYYAAPNKIYIYMMAGLAVLGSDMPEIRRAIEGNNIGMTFNPESPKDIARQINKLLKSGRIDAYRKNSLAASKKHTWATDSKAYRRAIIGT
jgi:glycogen synthase